jgi:uncharacterized protein YbjT (DUF2867 family)
MGWIDWSPASVDIGGSVVMILVIGATGKVGRHVVTGLLAQGSRVRALVRSPGTVDLPAGTDVVRGDLADPAGITEHLEGVESVFLVWPFFTAEGASEVVKTLASHTSRIVYLSAEAAGGRPDSSWAAVERAIERSAVEWTFLRPVGFAANTLMWADQIRETGVVRWPYGQAARSLIHERDIADVAVRALSEDSHVGARYVLTGPETLTQIEQAHAIGDAIGRTVKWDELSREDAEDELAGLVPDTALDTWAGFVEVPEVVTSTVAEVTGSAARGFDGWAREHADDFR